MVSKDKLKYHEHYEIFREYLRHEDDLIHQRTTWNWTIQALLFGAYGFGVKEFGSSPAAQNPNYGMLWGLTAWIPFAGLILSILSVFGIYAAHKAITQLHKDWCRVREIYGSSSQRAFLPELTGGGSTVARKFGISGPLGLPGVFALAWLYLLTPTIHGLIVEILSHPKH